jgi:Fe-S cluster assembly scaffold protein SufB
LDNFNLKEIVINCYDYATSVHTIMCDDQKSYEGLITIKSSYVGSAKIILWVSHASKKIIIKTFVDSPNATIDLRIYIKADHNAQHYLEIIQNHNVARTVSTCNIRGIAYDTSIINYQGLITLEKKSINAQAEQKSNFLIMSENAAVKSIPSLQVQHSQVQCGHATTISYIDPLVMWYASQRGIDTATIEKIVEKAFFI